jgi:hypothetical protein
MTEVLEITRTARRSAVLLLVLALTGCGVWPLGRPSDWAASLPGDQMVFAVTTAGGLAPPLDQTLITPALAVYGDGRVFEADHDQYVHGTPYAYVVGRADTDAVARFVARAEARQVVKPGTDFGDPQVTDMPVTTVRLHGNSDPQLVHVYAFGKDFDDDVSRTQRRARQDLREIVDDAYALPGDGERLSYTPDRVQVTELDISDDGSTPAPEWPGPDPDSFLVLSSGGVARVACGTLAGTNAEVVYAAARNHPRGVWTHDSRTRVLAVVPLLPGAEGCR